MASSSSSSSQSRKHDVFLSFRGTDTRNTFVDHLYSTLVRQGIYTYKDDQTLPRGETIGPSLLNAIEESQIAVVIFSENYADSSWCLQELAHIMKCKDERGLIVIPIFYHIDPSELRNQKRKYGEAFAEHESKNKNVESWRKALVDAGNLSGYVANGPETTFIKQIVDTISSRLCLAISGDDEDLIGIKARLQDLKSKMEMESDGVVMVGVWGLGGSGKTTLANALYEEIRTNFDGSCFLKDVREESSKHGLEALQEKILSTVLKQKRDEVVGDAGRLIKRRLQRKKVLMVLDDVDHADQLQELAGSNAWFGKGSRIIITTRDEHVLNAHRVKARYNISLLNDEEAMKLFYKHALQDDRPVEDYEMLSKEVVSYAGGLPLALKVLGSFLCDKDMNQWKSALAKLKEIPNSDIIKKLKISYDGLESEEKDLFLDIACFFRGATNDQAMEIFDACGYHPIIGIKVLIQKALITMSEEGRFHMHDLIQEMGYNIVRGENLKNPELHSRVWQHEDIDKICACMDTTKENDTIKALQVSPLPWEKNVPPNILHVFGNMKKLRWIYCPFYLPATSLPREFQPMELCYLKLKWSSLEQLWEGDKHLPNLKVLDLSSSNKLVRTPNFDGLPCLERLILRGCVSLKEIHPSIGYHERLTLLDMDECESFEIFPPIIRMKKLKTLILSDCDQLRKFPEIQTSMDNMVEVSLARSGIEIVPSSIGRYCTNLLSLDLTDCRNLESIEGNFHRLKILKVLFLDGCDELKNIPKEGLFNVECHLQVLTLSSAFRRINLHQLLGFSRCLRRLSLAYCNLVDGDISLPFEELSNLEALDLSGNDFERLHSSLSQLPRLKFLDLSSCKKLVELSNLPPSIAILIAFGCDSLEIVEDFPSNHLKWLWNVQVSGRNINCERLLQSMLQGNAIEDYFIKIYFGGDNCIPVRGFKLGTFTLQLPWNWCNEFCGFLVYTDYRDEFGEDTLITIDDEDDEKKEEEKTMSAVYICYISFGALRHTSWWNSTRTSVSFSLGGEKPLKVELVPRRSQGDGSIERANDTTYRSEFWNEESLRKTFEIKYDSRSSIQILWNPDG